VTTGRSRSLPVRLSWTTFLALRAHGQTRFPFIDPDEVRTARDRAVRRMVGHAWRTVPWYREALRARGLRREDLTTAGDLARLPFLEGHDLQVRPDSLASTEHPRDRCLTLRSGGSTGTPHGVRHDPGSVIANVAHGERDRAIVARHLGRWAGYRQLSFAPPFASGPEIQAFVGERTVRPAGARIERLTASVFEDFDAAAARIDRERPDVVQGYGSYVGALFRHISADGRQRHRPRVVTYSSDALSEADRRLIEEELGIPVLGRYQAIEALKIAFQCGAGPWMHVNEDLYPVRIVDDAGRTVADGEPGHVVVSNLVNRATVLLNYRLEDRARRVPGPCPCGRTLPRMSVPEGRSDDWIALPSGEVLHPLAVRTLFVDEAEVWEYQVIQESPTRFRVNLVVAPGAAREELGRRAESKFAARLGPGTTVAIAFVGKLARTPGGKVRGFVRLPESAES
jgi:phenylacetate-CoA ligase